MKVIHKPSGTEKELNQTHALRLLEYSKKHGGHWQEVKAPTKKVKATKKDENTKSDSGSSDS